MARDTKTVENETNGVKEVKEKLVYISRDEFNQLQLTQINEKLDYLISNLIKIEEEPKKE
jgi:hypothetical protein